MKTILSILESTTYDLCMNSSPDISSILEDLAAGRIDTAEASRRIDAQSAAGRSSATDSTTEQAAPRSAATDADHVDPTPSAGADAPSTTGDAGSRDGAESTAGAGRASSAGRSGTGAKVERVSLRVIGRRVRIVAEPAVATVAVDGPHVLKRNGAVMEVSSDGEFSASIDGFQLLRSRRLDDFRALSIGKELFVRVNPRLLVDAEVTGGSLVAENIVRLGRIRITAGSAKLTGVGQVEDAIVQAGQLTLTGAICTGHSRVRAESGSLSLRLEDDSDVTVHGEAQLGKISWSGGHTGAGDEVVMGEGRAKLDVGVVMGFAQIRVGSEAGAQA